MIGSEVKAVFLLVIGRRSFASKCPKSGQYYLPLSKRVQLKDYSLGILRSWYIVRTGTGKGEVFTAFV